MYSDKMSKCCCDLFKKHKKTSNYKCRYVLSQTFFYCVTPMSHSKTGRNYVFSAERKSCKCQGKCQLNRASPVPPRKKTEKQWHNMSHCFVNWHTRHGLESSSDDWIDLRSVTAFQNIDLSSRFRVRHWTNAVDTLFDNTYRCSYFLFVYLEWITTDLLIFFTFVIIVWPD